MLVPSKDLEYNADDEVLLPLFENDWLRMLLIRNRHSEDQVVVEIELSLPMESSESSNDNPYEILEMALMYLEFMKRLCDNGFSLQLVDRDWLWTASIDLSRSIEPETIFGILELPKKSR